MLGPLIAVVLGCATTSQPPTSAELDLVRDQYRSELRLSLASLDRELAKPSGMRELDEDALRLARARVLRLRGEYADAEAELDWLAAHAEPDDAMIQMWVWFERSMNELERDALRNLPPARGVQAFMTQQLERVAELSRVRPPPLVELERRVERETSPGAGEQAQAELAAAWQIVGLRNVLYWNHYRVHQRRGAEGYFRRLDGPIGALLPMFFLGETDKILGRTQTDELVMGYPELERGGTRSCDEPGDPWNALYCAEDLLFAGYPETLGLGGSKRVAEFPSASILGPTVDEYERGTVCLAQAGEHFRRADHARGHARVEQLAALHALRQVLIGNETEVADAEGLLVDVASAASKAGDRKLEIETRAHLAFLAALDHDRATAETLISEVVEHIATHQDHGMAASLAWTAVSFAQLQIRRRADIVAGELLLTLGARLYDDPALIAGAYLQVAFTYRSARALHKARDMLATAHDVVDDRESEQAGLEPLFLEQAILDEAVEIHVAGSDLGGLRLGIAELEAFMAKLPHPEFDMDELVAAEGEVAQQARRQERAYWASLSSQSRAVAWDLLSGDLDPEGTTRLSAQYLESSRALMRTADQWVLVRLARTARMIGENARVELALLEEREAVLSDPERTVEQGDVRLGTLEAALARQRPDVLAELMVAQGHREQAIEMLRRPPDQGRSHGGLAGFDGQFGSRSQGILAPQHLARRFRALVDLGAYAEAGPLLIELSSPSRPREETHDETLQTLAAVIRWAHARGEEDVMWGHVASVEDELRRIELMGELRLRRGSLTRRGLSTAVAAAADVNLAAGNPWTAAELLLRAQPPELVLGDEGQLAELAARHDILLANRESRQCQAGCPELDAELAQIGREYEQMIGWPLRSDAAKLDLRDLPIEPGRAILTHLVSEDAVHTVLLRPGREAHVTRHEVEYLRLRGRVQRLGTRLGRGLTDRFIDPELERLSSILLPDPPELEGIERLIIVPHDIVADVPFALLSSGERVLSETMELVELPNLKLYDPAPVDPDSRRLRSRVLVADQQVSGDSEAQRLGKLLRTRPRPATMDGFHAALRAPRVDLVHVIAHGLAAGDGQTASIQLKDGRLGAEQLLVEFAGESLAARHVVFSACEVGSARASLDDPGFRFGATLLRHGLEQIIVPLWRVEDTPRTARFWELFYAALRDENSMVEALHLAQRAASSEGLPVAVWGGYKVISRS